MMDQCRLWMIGCLLGVLFGASACGPEYPKCDDNEDCQKSEKGQAEGKLFCVRGLCQQCIADADCGDPSMECNAGACEKIEGYCTSASDCTGGFKCKQNRCKPECSADGDCGDGMKCENQRCVVAPECTADADCDPGEVCEGGECVAGQGEQACQVETVYFAYDSSQVSSKARDALEANARCIKERGASVLMAGHADMRGSEEYNIALGERRARACYDFMRRMGISTSKLRLISYGEEMPRVNCDEADPDSCHRQNRRVEFTLE